ncbi:OVARIAN TUMOR DOMAIN-containing deubiquitinating enzyme 2 isoform X5 [Physcomitrium patens]|nr:ubiquitin thioesterase OTU1-like isoform X1 [Physcomitrium patens]|eukprot:XP_024365994.1 ubiquitin thioesterase OTU1-like isoform X1 [Physcomitrella patens]
MRNYSQHENQSYKLLRTNSSIQLRISVKGSLEMKLTFRRILKEILAMADESVVVRRVIPSDNSCLFNAVGYVMDKDKHKAKELRQVIAATVLSDPTTYSEAILGKPNQEYVEWISNPDKWGGAIELAILSDHYGREIAAYDIQTKRCDLYGQGKGYIERVMLLYDGLHYDALGLAPFPGAPEEVDQTIFSVDKNGNIGSASRLAERVVEEAHRARKFTDTGNFTLRCGVCQKGAVGQAEAVEHAKATGHTNFQEYS